MENTIADERIITEWESVTLSNNFVFFKVMQDEKSQLYSRLPDSYVIIICCFDMFDAGLHKYTFTNKCDEVPGLELGDGVKYIVLNTKSTKDDVSEELRNFLDFVDGKKSTDDEYIADLDIEVKKARLNKEWRREYMTIEQINLENQEIGKEIGIGIGEKRGKKIGISIGEERGKEYLIISMFNRGKSADEIVDFTGLSYDHINGIQSRGLALHESEKPGMNDILSD